MNPTLIVMIVALAAVTIALTGTWYAWWDYRRYPERYGYRPGERERLFTTPERGVTREPIRRWPIATGDIPSQGRARGAAGDRKAA